MQEYNNVSVLIIGAGPAGLATAITLKKQKPDLDIVVIDKAAGPGNHNLSGAVLEPKAIAKLMDPIDPNWAESDEAKGVLLSKVNKDDVMFLLGNKLAFPIEIAIKMAKAFRLAFGQMAHSGDYICSVSKLAAWLSKVAVSLGVEVLYGFAAEDILWDESEHIATGIKLVDQGLDKEGQKQSNYLAGETITAKTVIIAEGCDGLLAEKFIQKAQLIRQGNQLYSIGVKELIKVSDEQYQKFSSGRVVHAMGYPIWTPAIGPSMFGGGIMYPMGDNHIAVGMIVGLDFKYCDFNPQDALTRFKGHKFVK
ncbi:MAG: NAD(P)/FAD-dependent oxidoreductase, partial [Planctomycetota bacterium]